MPDRKTNAATYDAEVRCIARDGCLAVQDQAGGRGGPGPGPDKCNFIAIYTQNVTIISLFKHFFLEFTYIYMVFCRF